MSSEAVQSPTENILVKCVQKYGRLGILLDTNILLVYVIGRFDQGRIEHFKRTNTFTRKDYVFLEEFLTHFERIVTTPHVLTEVSNLAANLSEPDKSRCFKSFAADIEVLEEHFEGAKSIARSTSFRRLGITDASLSIIARDRFLVLTDDLGLYSSLLGYGVDAINFNHIRLPAWA